MTTRTREPLPHEYEAMFAGLHADTAQIWHEAEELCEELGALARDVEDAPIIIPVHGDVSTVVHLRTAARSRPTKE